MRLTISELNQLEQNDFVRLIGPVFEHSPWIAETAWSQRPFASLEKLHAALCESVRDAGEAKQLALILAHPDLVGKLARAGCLTKESTREQASAGLDRLTADELQRFSELNDSYKTRFGFPFIMAVKGRSKAEISAGFEARLRNDAASEFATALQQIDRIAELRLKDILP